MNGVCYIFCAMPISNSLPVVQAEDFVIAADGGYAQLWGTSIVPDLILGDFDSLGSTPQGDNVLVFPPEKDYTDLDLALREGSARGYRTFCIYGALGGRLDHTFANLQLLTALARDGARGYLVDEVQCATVIENDALHFLPHDGGYVSVFALGEAEGIDLVNLKYSLSNARLDSFFPLGVSNEFIGSEATVRVRQGRLLVIWQHGGNFDPNVEKL